MKWLLVISLLLAGCATPQTDVEVAEDVEADDSEALILASINLTVDFGFTDLYDEVLLLSGSANAALVEIYETQGGNRTRLYSEDVNGTFNHTWKPGFGKGSIEVVADNGNETESRSIFFTQWAPATMQVRYGAGSSNDPVDDEVWVDVDALASAALYDDVSTAHPGYATIHDAMVTWEWQHAHEVFYGHSDGLGFSVDQIDGDGNPVSSTLPPYWLFTVNGESADFGITLQPFTPGDVIQWCLGSC